MSSQKLDTTPQRELVCPYCQDKVDDLESHFNGGFKNGETSSCSNCNLVIPNEQCLLSHIQIVHKDAKQVFSCEVCYIDFSSRNYLFIHKTLDQHNQIEKENENEFEAEIFNSQIEVIEIRDEVEDDLFDNSPESHETESEFEIQKPQIESNENKGSHDIQVEILEEVEEKQVDKEIINLNKEVQNLKTDKNQSNLKDSRPYKCEKCYKTFKRRDHLRSHEVQMENGQKNEID